jgi:hypothetical protein
MTETKRVRMYESDWQKVEQLVDDGVQAAKLRRVVDMAERFEETQDNA